MAPKNKAAKLQGSNKSVARAATAVGAGLQELLLPAGTGTRARRRRRRWRGGGAKDFSVTDQFLRCVPPGQKGYWRNVCTEPVGNDNSGGWTGVKQIVGLTPGQGYAHLRWTPVDKLEHGFLYKKRGSGAGETRVWVWRTAKICGMIDEGEDGEDGGWGGGAGG